MTKAHPSKKPSAQPATMPGLKGWVEVFKAGTHVDSSGKQCTFTQADLDQMVGNHALGAAPAVLGHPKHDAPAYAWVGEYKRDGDTLFAKFRDINPAFEKGVLDGAYRNRSVSVYPDKSCGWRVRHVGWLGAAPPAIDGLAPCEFAALDADCLEFAAPGYSLVWGLESAARLLRKLRDQMIEKDGLEAADQTLPQWEIDSMNESVTSARAQFNAADELSQAQPAFFNQPGENDMSFTQADLDAATAAGEATAKAAAATAAAAAASNFSAAQTELLSLKKERQTERIAAQIKGWKEKGLILPAEEAGLAEYMAAQEDAGEFTFSRAEGGEGKKTPAQFFSDFMATRKPVIKLGGGHGGDQGRHDDGLVDGSDPHQLAEAAQSYMKQQADKGITVSLPEAVARAAAQAKG